jgi:hypothetical protein
MAIQEYVRSIAATQTVSKEEVFRFLEMQFARADRNHDGLLDIDELALCAQLSNWAGFNFRRTGRTLGGTPFRDLRRSDGTWGHLERREREIVVEWTTRDGACRKRVFRRPP